MTLNARKKPQRAGTMLLFALLFSAGIVWFAVNSKATRVTVEKTNLGIVTDAVVGEKKAWHKISRALKTHRETDVFVVSCTMKYVAPHVSYCEIEYNRRDYTVIFNVSDSSGGAMRAHDISEAKIYELAPKNGSLFISVN